MSMAVYDVTEKDIDLAYKEKNKPKIEKETNFILSQLFVFMSVVFKNRLQSIDFDSHDFQFDKQFITSEKNRIFLLNWLDKLVNLDEHISDFEFGKLKLDLEEWFYLIGGKEISFTYQKDYLLTPSDVAEKLKVSTVTVNKYVKQGMEMIDTTSHHKFPKHVVPLWQDPASCLKMQMIAQNKKLIQQTGQERFIKLSEEIAEFQYKYGVNTVSEAFKEEDVDSLDDPFDYFEWRDLEEEKNELLKRMKEEK